MHQVGPLDRHGALGTESASVVVAGASDAEVQLLREILADLGVRVADAVPPPSQETRTVVVVPAPPAAALRAEEAREWIARVTRDVTRPTTGRLLLTTITALQQDPSALERLAEFVEAHSTADQIASARRRLPAGSGRQTDVDALLADVNELSTLVQQLSALHEETVGLASAIASTAGTLPWVLTNLATGPRLLVRRVRMALKGRSTSWRPIPIPTDLAERPLGVNLAGYIGAESGMGEAARTSIRALQAAGIPVALNNVEGPVRAGDRSFTDFTRDNPHPINLIHLNADNMAWFASDRGRAYFTNRYTIGFWFWELGAFRRDWQSAFGYVHEVWVASRFVQHALASVSPVPVVCLPPPVTARSQPPSDGRTSGLPEDRFLFSLHVRRLEPDGAKEPAGGHPRLPPRRARQPRDARAQVHKCRHGYRGSDGAPYGGARPRRSIPRRLFLAGRAVGADSHVRRVRLAPPIGGIRTHDGRSDAVRSAGDRHGLFR